MINKVINISPNPIPQNTSRILTHPNIKQKYQDEYNPINKNSSKSLFKSIINFTGSTLEKTNLPLVAIISNFDQKVVDIDGDNEPDLSHGDTVSRIIKGFYPKVHIKPVKIKSNEDGSYDMNEPISRLKELSELIDKNEPVKAVNLTLGQEVSINALRELTKLPLNQENLKDHKEQICEWIKKPTIPLAIKTIMDIGNPGKSDRLVQEFKIYNEVIESIEKITKKGIPVYISAGNQGPEFFNILILAKGAIPVGMQDTQGRTNPFSANNSLINRYEQGVYNISIVNNKDGSIAGYDITGDNKPEVLPNEVSGKEPVIKAYLGKKVNDILATEEDYSRLIEILNNVEHIRKVKNEALHSGDPEQVKLAKKIKDITTAAIGSTFDEDVMERKSSKVLFPINMIANLYKLNPDTVNDLKSSGNYVNASLQLIFKTDKAGKIYYDPDNSGRPAINRLIGSSGSVPKAIAVDIEKENSKK